MLYRLIALIALVGTLGYADVAMVKSDEVYARSYGPRTLATLNKALAAIGDVEKTLVVDGGEWDITDDVEVPSNVTLDVRNGSTFSGDGQITGLSYARPEWWGADPLDANPDADAIQEAINSSDVVLLSSGTYYIDIELLMDDNQSIIGNGINCTIFKMYPDWGRFENYFSASFVERNNGSYPFNSNWFKQSDCVTISGISFDGNAVEMYDALGSNMPKNINGIALSGVGISISDCLFKNLGLYRGTNVISSTDMTAVHLSASTNGILNNEIKRCVVDGFYIHPDNESVGVSAFTAVTHYIPDLNDIVNYWDWSFLVAQNEGKGYVTDCIIRNCKNAESSSKGYQAYFKAFDANFISGCSCLGNENVDPVLWDTGWYTPVVIKNNYFEHEGNAIYFSLDQYGLLLDNVSISGNIFNRINIENGDYASNSEIVFYGINDPGTTITNILDMYPLYRNIVISDNFTMIPRGVNPDSALDKWQSGYLLEIDPSMPKGQNPIFDSVVIKNNVMYGSPRIWNNAFDTYAELVIYGIKDFVEYGNYNLRTHEETEVYCQNANSQDYNHSFSLTRNNIKMNSVDSEVPSSSLLGQIGGFEQLNIPSTIYYIGCSTNISHCNSTVARSGRFSLCATLDSITESDPALVIFDPTFGQSNRTDYISSYNSVVAGLYINPQVVGHAYKLRLTDYSGLDESSTLLVTEDMIGKWNLLTVSATPTTNGMAFRLDMDMDIGTNITSGIVECYIDDAFLCDGSVSGIPVYFEANSVVTNNILNHCPRYIGEEVYSMFDDVWYKSFGVHTNEWKALN